MLYLIKGKDMLTKIIEITVESNSMLMHIWKKYNVGDALLCTGKA